MAAVGCKVLCVQLAMAAALLAAEPQAEEHVDLFLACILFTCVHVCQKLCAFVQLRFCIPVRLCTCVLEVLCASAPEVLCASGTLAPAKQRLFIRAGLATPNL